VKQTSRVALVEQLQRLGLCPGDLVVVHTSFSKIGPVDGGPAGLIAALRECIGADGTLAMPSMSDDDDEPFDPARTPCAGMGIVAETFWRMPGVLRSDSPHAFAAVGPLAKRLTEPHPVHTPHGLDSPVGRVYELDGRVLLLGVGHDANTTIHLAENLAAVPYRTPKYATVLQEGRAIRVDYAETDHCCVRFALLDNWLDPAGLQRRGSSGRGEARLMQARDVVLVALEQLNIDPLVFLHDRDACEECDKARDSIKV
jgi:aminoglycoside N3'-acetyltransferase